MQHSTRHHKRTRLSETRIQHHDCLGQQMSQQPAAQYSAEHMVSTCSAISRSRDRRPQARVPQSTAGRAVRTSCKLVWKIWAMGTLVFTMTGMGCRGSSSQLRSQQLFSSQACWGGGREGTSSVSGAAAAAAADATGAQDAADCLCATQTVTGACSKGGAHHQLPCTADTC